MLAPIYETRSEALGSCVATSANITDVIPTNLMSMEDRTVYSVSTCWKIDMPWYVSMRWGFTDSSGIMFQTGFENTMSIRVDTNNGKSNQTLLVPGKIKGTFVVWAAVNTGVTKLYGGINHRQERLIDLIPGDGFTEQQGFRNSGTSVISTSYSLAFSGFHDINTRTKIISTLLAQHS